jgi:exosortase/archaeosortase family protein
MLKAVSYQRVSTQLDSPGGSQTAFLLSLLTLGSIAADQIVAPILYSSSPLWAAATGLLLIWRRGQPIFGPTPTQWTFSFSHSRIVLFAAAHILLVLCVWALISTFRPVAGGLTLAGWLVAAMKLSVFAPTILLLPISQWRPLARLHFSEIVAALVVLFTFFPGRILDTLWPLYGQALGRFVFYLAKIFVPSLTYIKAFTPMLSGPDLDVTILPSCSGINGIELFDYLFAFVVLIDWRRLRKGPTLLAYLGGLAAILLGNALRITSFVVLGNHGFAYVVERFHISAGWIFFSFVFLAYLSVIYHGLLLRPSAR